MSTTNICVPATLRNLSTLAHIKNLTIKCDIRPLGQNQRKSRTIARRYDPEARPLSCFSSLKKRRLINELAIKKKNSQSFQPGFQFNDVEFNPKGSVALARMGSTTTTLQQSNLQATFLSLNEQQAHMVESGKTQMLQTTGFVVGRQSTTPSNPFKCSVVKSGICKKASCKLPSSLYHQQWTNSGLMLSTASTAVPSTERGDVHGLSGSNVSRLVAPKNSSALPFLTDCQKTFSQATTAAPVSPAEVPSVLSNDRAQSTFTASFVPVTHEAVPPRQTQFGVPLQTANQKPSLVVTPVTPTRNGCGVAIEQQQQSQVVEEKSFNYYDPETQFGVDDGYIVTPGKHRIHINNFLMQADQEMQEQLRTQQPAIAAMASYAQDIYTEWRQMEQRLDRKVFQLSFHPGSDIERFRQMALHCILQYTRDAELSGSTAHCSIHNVHRVLLHYVQQLKIRLTANMFFGTIAACLRMALKHEETPEKTRPFRDSPTATLWKTLGVDDTFLATNATYLNKIEVECLKILENPLTPPSGPDYLDRYLTVGGWPVHLVEVYRDIALYLVNLALFSRRDTDSLAGLPPSLLAASALALGIKVISAGQDDGYEFWPQRLVVYSGYTVVDLRPGVRGLSALLRSKPSGSDILEHFHPVWARYDWK